MIVPGTLRQPLIIFIGATFNPSITWSNGILGNPVDLTGYDAVMEIRNTLADPEPLLTLSRWNGGILIPYPLTGVMNLFLTAAQTACLSPTVEAPAVFDLQVTAPSNVQTDYLLQGQIQIQQMVTR